MFTLFYSQEKEMMVGLLGCACHSALGRQRLEDLEFEKSLGYKMRYASKVEEKKTWRQEGKETDFKKTIDPCRDWW